VLGLDVDRILFSHGAEVVDPITAIRELLVEDRREPSL
jgi:hypothetical protein